MAKKTPLETDMARLQKKVTERRTAAKSPEDNSKLRSLHKRLKRAQRKKRRLITRKQHAMGKKAGAQKA
ncbi:MAG TPA: hypothetical protein VJV04_08600 [Nitrospiraceae bacterium]|nr:hypothetical protein [Nitrospiraceae bacterium]